MQLIPEGRLWIFLIMANIPNTSMLGTDVPMPMVGLGTWQSAKGEVKAAVKTAVALGYRHIDCAYAYGNEEEVGEAVQEILAEGKVKREDLFIVSKLWNTRHRPDLVEPQMKETLEKLGVDYIDLWLMHFPFCYKSTTEVNLPKDENGNVLYDDIDYLTTWKSMESVCKKGLTRAIGCSNFNSEQIQRLIDEGEIKPACNQVEVHPYFAQEKLVLFCQARGVAVVAFSPLGCAQRPWGTHPGEEGLVVFDDPVIIAIGNKYGKSPAQVALRWHYQRQVIVIPKSVNPDRIKQNMEIFDFTLNDEDMAAMKQLDRNMRMVVPFVFRNGKKECRDKDAPYFPFNIEF